MIKSLLKRRQPDTDTLSVTNAQPGYAITSARLGGRSVIAFEKHGGQAAALEVTDRGAEILRGLAAGAVMSELEEARQASHDTVMPLSRDGGASLQETEAFIQSLDLLDGLEKKALLGALPR